MTLSTPTPDRILPVPSVHNFRDIGGYKSRDGRHVQWRQIYRSGYMSRIDAQDAAQLSLLKISSICDLRTNTERQRSPTVWHHGTAAEIWVRDYDFSAGALGEIMHRTDATAADTHALMLQLYRELPFEQAVSYREMFKRIVAGRVPLLFNCSAGKDRTGVASALLLAILGVSDVDIDADYMLTNQFTDGLIAYMSHDPVYAELVQHRLADVMPLLRAESEYLAESFAQIIARHGSVAGYATDVLGVSADEQDAIRARLLAK